MARIHLLVLEALALVLLFAPSTILGREILENARDVHQKRDFDDSFIVFNRLRNGHACIMSIVFIVLYPLGAISIHLPIDKIPGLKNTYLRQKVLAIHVPIQILALVMMTGAMGLGIRLAHDLNYFDFSHPVKGQEHVVIGLIVTSTLILFQPAMGILQHLHYKKTSGKSIFAYLHRWLGRGAIVLGMINNGLGFQLASHNVIIESKTYVRNFTLLGVLVTIWVSLVVYDEFFKPKGPKTVADGGEKGSFDKSVPASAASGDGTFPNK